MESRKKARDTKRGSTRSKAAPATKPVARLATARHQGSDESVDAEESLRRILSLLKIRFGIDFSQYKLTTIRRRIERQMNMKHFEKLGRYADHLAANADAVLDLHDELFVHVTQFFRDQESFKAVRERVLPPLLMGRSPGVPIRVWVPGCSTGEEAYSLAMMLSEYLEERGVELPVQIFATDISERAIEQARRAVYSEALMAEVSEERRQRHFERVNGGFKVRKQLRDLCIVSRHDLTTNPPFARLDLVSCRNVLIYFGAELQQRIFQTLHYALSPGAFLWLGNSESPGASSKLFAVLDKQHRIYSKLAAATASPMLRSGASAAQRYALPVVAGLQRANGDYQRSADQLLLSRFAPPGVVVDHDLQVLQFRGKTAPFLQPASGTPSHHLLKMAHPHLVTALRPLLQAAHERNAAVHQQGLVIQDDLAKVVFDLEILPLNPTAPERERQLLLVFDERPQRKERRATEAALPRSGRRKVQRGDHGAKQEHVEQLQAELDAVHEHQHTLIEQFESTQEELTSANEELQATNEELQSTNEELETAKEELQSANEELTTTNDALHDRNAELQGAYEKLARGEDRFRLMVDSVKDYAIYMLDPEGHVASWNEGARRLKGYEAVEIVGENYARFFLADDRAASAPELELEQARVEGRFEAEGWRIRKNGSRFWANVVLTRINDTSGALVGFSKVTRDLTERKRAEEELRALNESLEQRVRARTQELQQALQARDQFVSIASHELKTPLTALKLQLQLAARAATRPGGILDATQATKVFDRALSQCLSLEHLVEDLLDVSRIQSGLIKLEMTPVDAAKLIQDVVTRFSEQLVQAQIDVELELEPDMVGSWDRRRIEQVLANLISNAIKYAPRSELRISLAPHDAHARIVVADSGPGISLEKQSTIFDRFERAGVSPSVGGLGLGLFIARRIVEAHHGSVSVESELGCGARFIVDLPVAPSNAEGETSWAEGSPRDGD